LVELRRSQAGSKAHLEEVNNKFLLLQERVEEDRRVVDDLRQMAFPVTPPQELKVVKLSEAEGEGGQKREEKKAEKRGAEKRDGKSELPKPAGPIGYEPEDIYRRAQDLFWSGKLNDAVDVFKRFTVEYPRHHLADNALYWTGEAYYSQEKYRKALDEFLGLIEQYPKGNKAPDALLKVAYSYIELDRSSEAEEALMRVIKTYPGSESAIKAKQTIKELYTNRRGEQ
jgi:tol-pal system protein YbgF